MTTRRVFLYGNVADNFESNSAPFVQAAGGSSAKIALLLVTPEVGIVWGSKVTTPTNEYLVRTEFYLDPYEDGDVELRVGEGLGLLRDCIIEVHFSGLGGFPRMVQAMELANARCGLGMDDPICLEVQDESLVKVHGRGRAHMRQLKRASDRRSSSRRRIETTGAGSRQAAWSRYAAKAATRPALPA